MYHFIIGTGNLPEELGNDIVSAITQLNSEIAAPDNTIFIFDYKNGKYGYNTDPERDANTFCLFSEIDKQQLVEALANSGMNITIDSSAK